MKRKLSETEALLSDNINVNCEDKTRCTISSDSKEVSENSESAAVVPHSKRMRCTSDVTARQNVRNNTDLLDTIRIKIMELQGELGDLDDSDAENEVYSDNDNEEYTDSELGISKEHARILGFATCAQETLRFLLENGVATTDQLYIKLCKAFSDRFHSV